MSALEYLMFFVFGYALVSLMFTLRCAWKMSDRNSTVESFRKARSQGCSAAGHTMASFAILIILGIVYAIKTL